MKRRSFLHAAGATTLLGSLSGCLFGTQNSCHGIIVNMRGPLTDAEIASKESRAVDSLNPVARRLVESALEHGPITYASQTEPHLRDGRVIRIEETYASVVVEQQGETTVTGYEYEVETNDSIREEAKPEETVDISDLPSHDHTSFIAAFGPKATGIREGDVEAIKQSMLVAYTEQAKQAESAFIPESTYQYVRYGKTVFRVRLVESKHVTVNTYRIRIVTKADSPQEFAEQIRSSVGIRVDPSTLSEKAREFVRESMEENGATVCYPLPEHVQQVVAEFKLYSGTEERYIDYGEKWYEVWRSEFAN